MKNGRGTLLMICALSVMLVLGVFLGRNLKSDYAVLPQNDSIEWTPTESIDYRLDINTATKVQLMELPGIGESMADRILVYRSENGSFSSTDELMEIEGIGEKKMLQIQNLIKVGG